MPLTPREEQHLQLLAIFQYIVGGLIAFLACLPLIHLTIGLVMVLGGFFLVGQSLAICIIITGRFLARRKHYLFVFVVACCECLFMPFGTILGVFTIILLSRESAKSAFD
jgi:hypothetical protein